jgi:hypothetical protein
MKKSFIITALVISMLLSLSFGALAGEMPTSPYSDVMEGEWYYDIVCEFNEYGVITGYSDGTFGPNDSITRAEFAVILSRYVTTISTNDMAESDITFSDVNVGQWFYDDIMLLANYGIVNGYSDGTFQPNKNITREEIAYIMYKFMGPRFIKTDMLSEVPEDAYLFFPDVLADRWSADAIYMLYAYDCVSGYPDGTFRPEAKATRAEALCFLCIIRG